MFSNSSEAPHSEGAHLPAWQSQDSNPHLCGFQAWALASLLRTSSEWGLFYHIRFPEEETEAQRSAVGGPDGRAGSSVPFLGLHFQNPGASLGVMVSPARPLLFDTSSSQSYMCVSYMLVCYFEIRQMEKTSEFRRKCQDCRCLQGTWVGAGFLKVGF